MTSPLAEAFAQGPGWFPQQLDAATDRVLIVRMTEDDYRQASFLDQRMLGAHSQPQWAPWAELEAADQAHRRDADFIFHIGHVGSTLISRLLGEVAGVFALREPQILRNFADLDAMRGRPGSPWSPKVFDERLGTTVGWLSRTFDPEDRALIKATSFVNEIAGPLMGPGRKALFLMLPAERYVTAILSGENSRQELAMLAPSRLNRLHNRLGREPWNLWELSEPVRAAMSWLTEVAALDAAVRAAPEGHVLWLDFDEFLGEPADGLLAVARHFGHALDEEQAIALTKGPIMGQYSKAPEYGYNAEQRESLLEETRAAHAADIAEAMAWLDEAGAMADSIAETIARHSGQD
jgi:hypothetical protein